MLTLVSAPGHIMVKAWNYCQESIQTLHTFNNAAKHVPARKTHCLYPSLCVFTCACGTATRSCDSFLLTVIHHPRLGGGASLGCSQVGSHHHLQHCLSSCNGHRLSCIMGLPYSCSIKCSGADCTLYCRTLSKAVIQRSFPPCARAAGDIQKSLLVHHVSAQSASLEQ